MRETLYARLDTPIRTTLRASDQAIPLLTPDDTEEAVGLALLERTAIRVDRERDRLRTKIKSLKLDTSSAIRQEQYPLLDAVGVESQEGFEKLAKQAEIDCDRQIQQAEPALQQLLQQSQNAIQQEVQDVIDSKLFQQFMARLTAKYDPNRAGFDPDGDQGFRNAAKFANGFKKVADQVGAKVPGWASNGTQAGNAFFKSAQVSGSGLHGTIYGVGKVIGFKFKPWQAVNMAKGIGNVAKVFPVVSAMFGIVGQIAADRAEEKRERELNDARREIRGGFTKVTCEIEQQIDQQHQAFEQATYDEVQANLAQIQSAQLEQISQANENLQTLREIQTNLRSLLTQIQGLM